MTLYRELEVDEAAISNGNSFEKGTIFDAAGGSDTKRRFEEKAMVFHDELLQLSQTLHFKLCNGRERERSNMNGLEIGKAH